MPREGNKNIPQTWIGLHNDLEVGMNAFCLGIDRRPMWQAFKYLKMKLEVLCEFDVYYNGKITAKLYRRKRCKGRLQLLPELITRQQELKWGDWNVAIRGYTVERCWCLQQGGVKRNGEKWKKL